MPLSRRELIKHFGLLSTGFWLSEISLPLQCRQVLAQSTPRKLALLVGLNQYRSNAPPLKGCQTDIELHKELLVHRFGFNPNDVLTLVEEEATRGNIESAFISHLVDQAHPGDIVVFHFSGYGCLVRTKLITEGDGQTYGEQQALVTADAWIPNPLPGKPPLFNGIYEDTLFLLLRSLPTEQVVTLLDIGVRPSLELRCKSLRERALPLWNAEELSGAELAFQERLLQQTQLTRDQLQVQRKSGQVPGVFLTAATLDQPTALEVDRADFSAGLFSAHLLHQLWSTIPETTLIFQLGRLSTQMTERIGPSPQPTAKGQKSFGTIPWSTGGWTPLANVGSIASIDRRGWTAKLWLGGLSEALLAVYQPQSCFRCVNSATLLQLRSRDGWTAIGRHVSGPFLQAGQFVQEAIRVLPRTHVLKIALGSNLERIERVDATSSISMGKRRIQVVGTTQSADYVFTKIPAPPVTPKPDAAKNPALNVDLEPLPAASYGLAYLGGNFLPNTIGDRGEVVKLALQRLRPTLDMLLALKLLELTLNDSATSLRVTVTLEQIEDPSQPLMRSQTSGAPPPLNPLPLNPEVSVEAPPIPKADKTNTIFAIASGTTVQYRVSNWNEFPLYVLLIGFNSNTTAFMSYATEMTSPELERKPILKSLIVSPGTSILLPSSTQPWKASSGKGLNRIFIVLGRQPFTQVLAMQATGLNGNLPNAATGFTTLPKPLAVAQKIFEDLHQASLPTTAMWVDAKQDWILDTAVWASFQFTYRTT